MAPTMKLHAATNKLRTDREGEVIYWRDFVVVKYIDDFLDCTQNAFL